MTEVSIGYDHSPLNGPAVRGLAGPRPGERMPPVSGQRPIGAGDEPRADATLLNAGVANYDFAAFKTTHITERIALEFRSEMFNLFNRTQFSAPNSQLNSGSFGVVSGQSNNPRLLQFALRLHY